MEIRFSQEALTDIDSIILSAMRNKDKEEAIAYAETLNQRYFTIKKNPHTLSNKNRDDIFGYLFCINAGSHNIFYRIIDYKLLEIVRILWVGLDYVN